MCRISSALLWIAALAATTHTAQASFDANISSYVNVQIPVSLHVHNTSGGIEHRRAQFGAHWDFWRQEGHMAQMTYYADGTLCEIPSENVTKTFGEPPFFLLADLGGCTPVSKARRAQELGASGLILASHRCLCNENCTEEKNCDEHLPPLPDDGSGASISIPTMMIGRGKGEHVKSAMRKQGAVVMEMAWHTPRHEHNVSIDLWYTPTHRNTEDFLANFSSLALLLKDKLEFHPFPYIMDGTKMQCHQHANDPGSACYEMCTNNGRYCSVTHKGIHGKEVVIESLRRMCLWKHHAEGGFWDYVNHFQKFCQSADFFANKDCIKDVFKHSNVKEEAIEECMKDSGDVEADDTNSLLAEAVSRSEHIVETPTLWVNWLPLKWPMSTRSVFEAYCMGFAEGKAPHVCYVCGYCGDPVACSSRSPMHCNPRDGQMPDPKRNSTGGKKKKGGGFWKFMFVVFIVAGVGGFVYYKKYMENDGNGLGGYSLGEALMSDSA